MFALLQYLVDSVYLQFCDFHSFFIIFVLYSGFNPLSRWNIHKIFKCALTWLLGEERSSGLWVQSHGSVSPQLSDRAVQAIQEEEASVQPHQLPEALYHKVSWTLMLP